MKRQKKTVIKLAAGLVLLLVLSALLNLPGIQDMLYQKTGIAESLPTFTGPVPSKAGQALAQNAFTLPAPAGVDVGKVEPDLTAAVHFLDVGQGDAVLVESGGEYALIDAGPSDGVEHLMGYLDNLKVERLKYLVMSHPHSDHIGGMRAVVESLVVEKVLLPDLEKAPYPTTSTFEKLLRAMLEKKIPTEVMRAGATYPLGKGVVQVLMDGLPTEDEYNLISPMLLFESGDLRYLSSGDAEKPNEEAALAIAVDLHANLYKAAHHGSSTSNTGAFVRAVAPWATVISCGEGNSYGHPHREPLAVFEEMGTCVLRTDLNGFIRVSPDGTGGLYVEATRLDVPLPAAA